MKKICALLLSVILAFSMLTLFTSCSSDKDKIIGKWSGKINLANVINESLKSSSQSSPFSEYLDIQEFNLVLNYNFKDNGTYTLDMDKDELDKEVNNVLKPAIKSAAEKYLQSILPSGQDMSSAMSSLDTVIDPLCEQLTGNLEANVKGKYEIDEGKLFTSTNDEKIKKSNYLTYEFEDNDSIKFKSFKGDETQSTLNDKILPATFKKVK